MKKTILFSALVLAAGSVFAQEDKLAVLDTDTDGRISVEEAASDPALSAVFAELDVNKDGYLTPSELAEH
ncbi:MAG: hypothetical protein Alis3KO_19020 [Aliiglaciecola sp.]|uniref:hypothetical protein n=1 Tax=Aliiglaciecola sp. M165 TaxID=2593649 RepID=UPI00117D04C3|nr:hypothetical protein [Aliiglaciecola sp. M165]TRY30207.1 hypothetical protein FM019_15410 [Aliiglaciecola sp. M165]